MKMPSVYFLTVSQAVRLLGIESGKWEDTEFSLIIANRISFSIFVWGNA